MTDTGDICIDAACVFGKNLCALIIQEDGASTCIYEPKSPQDTGWRFFAGDEPEDYVTNPANFGILDINLIVNYSADVIPFLEMPVGTLLTRNDDDEFVSYEGEIDLNGESPDDIDPEAFG